MWDLLVINPMTNALLFLYGILGNNFFLSIAVFTIATRLITLPLNIRQQRSTMKMQKYQPQIQAIQKKYKDNPQKMQEEFNKIGYNPAQSLMGCLPLVVTMPIFLGLYRAIFIVLGSTPQALFEMQGRAASWIDLTALLPIANKFLWFNLGQPDQFLVLPVLVFLSMFVSQKFVTVSSGKNKDDKKKEGEADNPMAGMTQSMQYTMPIMFGVFALQFPAGLSLYFIISNLIGVVQGWITRRSVQEEEEEMASGGAVKIEKAAKLDAGVSSADRHIAASSVDDELKSVNGKNLEKNSSSKPAAKARRKSKRKRRA